MMILVEWTTSPSRGYVDALPDWVLDVDAPAVLVHAIVGPRGAGSLAKCEVRRVEDGIDFDTQPFAIFNDARGVMIGVSRLVLDAAGGPSEVLWRPSGGTAFVSGEAVVQYLPGRSCDDLDEASSNRTLAPTEQDRVVAARCGQGWFRRALVQRWNGVCALTGISEDALLRASHIKRWSQASEVERLDPSNGLLLAAHVDALFDRYLISFRDDGSILWSERVRDADQQKLSLPTRLERGLTEEEAGYMAAHREVFRG